MPYNSCTFPFQVDHSKKHIRWPHFVEIFTNVSHLFLVFNSSVNFYIYLVKHPKILRSLRSLCEFRKKGDNTRNTLHSNVAHLPNSNTANFEMLPLTQKDSY